METNEEICVGSVVKLRSGGPLMTVGTIVAVHICGVDRLMVSCTWIDDSGDAHSADFVLEVLRLEKR